MSERARELIRRMWEENRVTVPAGSIARAAEVLEAELRRLELENNQARIQAWQDGFRHGRLEGLRDAQDAEATTEEPPERAL